MMRKNSLPIVSLLTAEAISLVGNMLSAIAIPWFVLQTTGSATQTGITGFFTILPIVLAGFFGGALVDRLGYKRTSILADIASGITTALIPLLYLTIGLEFWQLMVLVFLGALLDAPGSTARSALVPELAEMARMPIERVTSLTHIVERGARLVGAPLAGLLIAVLGTENVLWLNELNPSRQTKKESAPWLMRQTPKLVRCLFCFQLYPFIVVEVNILIDQKLSFLKGWFLELA